MNDPEPILWLVFAGSHYYPRAGMVDCRYCGSDEQDAMTEASENNRADWVSVYALYPDGRYHLVHNIDRWERDEWPRVYASLAPCGKLPRQLEDGSGGH